MTREGMKKFDRKKIGYSGERARGRERDNNEKVALETQFRSLKPLSEKKVPEPRDQT